MEQHRKLVFAWECRSHKGAVNLPAGPRCGWSQRSHRFSLCGLATDLTARPDAVFVDGVLAASRGALRERANITNCPKYTKM